ncbi:MAG: cation transporter [Lachnospiraceae bacterium]|nr:cation transporter [Lachnospiraceae bacterium]
MITLLSKIFIKNRTDMQAPETRKAYGMLCGSVGIFLNIMLFILKFTAGLLSHSIAITADAFNNLSDAGSSVITLLGFKIASQKPDSDHPFGHGRVEYISGLLVSVIILLMAYELFKSSINKILHPGELECSGAIVLILAVSILVKIYMAYYNRVIGKQISSAAMKATSTDSLSDTIATSVVLAATLISHYTDIQIDGYCGLLVAVFICIAGINAARDTINPLLGQAPDPEFVDAITNIVMAHEEVIGIHDLIVHNYGPGRILISLHAEVPADGDILTLHDTIDLIEHNLKDALQCSAVIHMDPVLIDDEETAILKRSMQSVLAEIDGRLSLHDFRIVKGPTHTNMIFDVVVPFKFHYSDGELISLIQGRVSGKHPNHFVVIDVDRSYV